uniref:PHD-type domain-containing protein n=1 Tax=Branchiostoma floridae TaxID=7739 RepID=C3XT16_BRAFL|eukprot:XP_002612740.1 hypothetical protein BRAFLDRAFT_97280 [Branchiostoma floridae]
MAEGAKNDPSRTKLRSSNVSTTIPELNGKKQTVSSSKKSSDRDNIHKSSEAYNCGDCGRLVKDTDKAVECEICVIWFHARCAKVSDSLYQVITEEPDNCHWFCQYCKRGAKKLYLSVVALTSEIQSIHEKLDIVTQELTEVKSGIEKQTQQLRSKDNILETRIQNLEELSQKGIPPQQIELGNLTEDELLEKIVNATTDKVTRSVTEEVNQKLSEKEDQEARKLNLIVHNLPETGSKQGDIDSVTELFQEEFRLKMNVVNAQRMGRPNNDNTRLVKVTMNNRYTVTKENMAQTPLDMQLEHASQSFLREALNPGENILYRRRIQDASDQQDNVLARLRQLTDTLLTMLINTERELSENGEYTREELFREAARRAIGQAPLIYYDIIQGYQNLLITGYQTAPAPPPTFNLPSCSQLDRETLCNTLSGMGVETVDFSDGEEMTDPQLRTAIDSTVAFLTSASEMSNSEMSASEMSDEDSPQESPQESQYEGDEDPESGLGSQDQSGPQDTEEVDGDDQVGGSEGQAGGIESGSELPPSTPHDSMSSINSVWQEFLALEASVPYSHDSDQANVTPREVALRLEPLRHHLDPLVSAWADDSFLTLRLYDDNLPTPDEQSPARSDTDLVAPVAGNASQHETGHVAPVAGNETLEDARHVAVIQPRVLSSAESSGDSSGSAESSDDSSVSDDNHGIQTGDVPGSVRPRDCADGGPGRLGVLPCKKAMPFMPTAMWRWNKGLLKKHAAFLSSCVEGRAPRLNLWSTRRCTRCHIGLMTFEVISFKCGIILYLQQDAETKQPAP